MSYQSPYQAFVFEEYAYDDEKKMASFHYSFDGERHFEERVYFGGGSTDEQLLDEALKLAFYVVGTSYYKAFPTQKIMFNTAAPDERQAAFLQRVYHEGLSQFLFENQLTTAHMAQFVSEKKVSANPSVYDGEGLLVLQSGGKDSLLLATLLAEADDEYTPLYIHSSEAHPQVLDELSQPLRTMRRVLDIDALQTAAHDGALNGHVPVTYIVLAYALIDALLHNENTVLAAIGNEGAEPHAFIDDLPVNHQWSKTWEAEQLFSQYVTDYISPDLHVGSPLRGFSELRIAELFVEKCWETYGHSFSSCNAANYTQGVDNTQLKWCGECPKCANSYLLFSPFVAPKELQSLFDGKDLFAKPSLTETFKGLLGIDGVMKPFECVGEVDELRLAYHMAKEQWKTEIHELPYSIPHASFDYKKVCDAQEWITRLDIDI